MISNLDFLIVSAALFCAGMFAVLTRRNAIQVLIGIELMLNAANLNLVAFGRFDRMSNSGQVFALFSITLAAATTAVALAIILTVYKRYKTIDPEKIDHLKEQ